MAKKKTAEEIIIESWEGVKEGMLNKGFSESEWIGYVTAMTYSNDANKLFDAGINGQYELVALVRKMVAEGKI